MAWCVQCEGRHYASYKEKSEADKEALRLRDKGHVDVVVLLESQVFEIDDWDE